jgi:hypothetical protein
MWKPPALIGLVMTFPSLGFFALFGVRIAPSFAAMFKDFGSPQNLPFFTRLFVHPATPLVIGGFLIGGIVAGALRPQERFLILPLVAASGFVLTLFAMVSLYLPIWTLADNIK